MHDKPIMSFSKDILKMYVEKYLTAMNQHPDIRDDRVTCGEISVVSHYLQDAFLRLEQAEEQGATDMMRRKLYDAIALTDFLKQQTFGEAETNQHYKAACAELNDVEKALLATATNTARI